MTVATPRHAGAIEHSSVLSEQAGLAPAAALRALAAAPYDGPRLVVDLGTIAAAYRALAAGLGDAELFYAVKANPHPAILRRLDALGARFDVASRGEIQRCLDLGIGAEKLSFGNTIKRESDIAFAYGAGVRLFAVDAAEELAKIARAAPGVGVFCRLAVSDESADYPLGRKFGCDPAMAEALLIEAAGLGLTPLGLSFHVGSQMQSAAAWAPTVAEAARVWRRLRMRGLALSLLNIGGGFPTDYGQGGVDLTAYGAEIRQLLSAAFAEAPARIIAEPGRALVAAAGVLETEVLLVSRRSASDPKRWVYLDIGRYGGLAETEGEAIRYPILSPRADGPAGPCALAGPSCDSVDILYEQQPVLLPLDLKAGDRLRFLSAGAYITTYASQWFNGFEPLAELVVDDAP